MKINVITRCTRIDNLLRIKDFVLDHPLAISVNWHIIFDCNVLSSIPSDVLFELQDPQINIHFAKCGDWKCQYYAANDLISKLKDGYVYFVDDDNIPHPDFYTGLLKLQANNPDALGFIFSQWVGGRDFSKLDVRVARPENIEVGKIDLAQYTFHCKLPQALGVKFKDGYCADGDFIVDMYNASPTSFAITDQVLSYYNYVTEFMQIETNL